MAPKIFIDMDGVLALFDQYVMQIGNFPDWARDPNAINIFRYGSNRIKKETSNLMKNNIKFWENIPINPIAHDIIEFAKQRSEISPIILTTPFDEPSKKGKKNWLKKHKIDLPIDFVQDKYVIALLTGNEDCLLIDDSIMVIKQWEYCKGKGILYNTNKTIQTLEEEYEKKY